jgi:Tol biopolymer transport system component
MKKLLVMAAAVLASAAFADWGPAKKLPDNVNSPFKDFGVSVSADGNEIYFSSTREGGESNPDIYHSRRQGSGWTPAQKVPGQINTKIYEGEPCLSWDGRRLYFPRGDYSTGDVDIYVAERSGGGWAKPYKIPGKVNKEGYWENNPAVSGDGSTLYFVGYRWPGNQGSHNIWYSKWTGSEWGEPVYLSDINTERGESDPAPSFDGRYLYFLSLRVTWSKIFRAENVGGSWRNITPLNDNINRPNGFPSDPSVTADGKYLFFTWFPYEKPNLPDIYVSRWCEPAVTPTSLGRVKALFN